MQASGGYIIYINRKPLQPTNRPSITGRKAVVNKNRIYLKSYAKSKENCGFQLVKYVKGHISEQDQQEGMEGRQSRTERKKEAKKENRTLIVFRIVL